jgi:hypothetical protein
MGRSLNDWVTWELGGACGWAALAVRGAYGRGLTGCADVVFRAVALAEDGLPFDDDDGDDDDDASRLGNRRALETSMPRLERANGLELASMPRITMEAGL